MKIKVCGLKYKDNLDEVAALEPDYLGFIYFKKSKRYMAEKLTEIDLRTISPVKTAVFVDPTHSEVENAIEMFGYDALQFHGNESPEFCSIFRSAAIKVIKAFSVDDEFDLNSTKAYKASCDYFLFDTKGNNAGGNGVTFNWNVLKKYDQELPFFLSGGIGPENIGHVMELKSFNIYGIDINSRVESSPGIKDINKISKVMEIIREQ